MPRQVLKRFHKEERRRLQKSIACGFSLGATIGFLGAILLAPQAGKDTRQDISDGVIHSGLKLQRGAIRSANKAKELATTLSKNAKTVAGDVASGVSAVRHTVDEIRILQASLDRQVNAINRELKSKED